MSKVKAEDIRDNVERVYLLYDMLVKCKYETQTEFRARINVADNDLQTVHNKFTGRVNALEAKMVGALKRMVIRITDQDKTLEKLAVLLAPLTSSEWGEKLTEPKWTEIVRKHRKGT